MDRHSVLEGRTRKGAVSEGSREQGPGGGSREREQGEEE